MITNTFFVTGERRHNTPSRQDGIDPETEFQLRALGAQMIADGGFLLKLPQVTIATGQVIFHRFYHMKSFRKHDVKHVALSALFLSAKVEETPKKIRDVLNVFHHLYQKREGVTSTVPLDIMSQAYYDLKQQLINTERYILKDLGFILHVEHPHKFVCNFVHQLVPRSSDGGVSVSGKRLATLAWNYVNDSLHTDLCVQYQSECIAVAALYLAARQLMLRLPDDSPHFWWEVFDTSRQQIDDIIEVLFKLYTIPRPKFIDLKETAFNSTPTSSLEQSPEARQSDLAAVPSTPPASYGPPTTSTSPPRALSTKPEEDTDTSREVPMHIDNGNEGDEDVAMDITDDTYDGVKREESGTRTASPSVASGSEQQHSKSEPSSKRSENEERRRKDDDKSSGKDRSRHHRNSDKDKREKDTDRDRDEDKGRDGYDRDGDKYDRDVDRYRERDRERDRDRDRDRKSDSHRHSKHKDKEKDRDRGDRDVSPRRESSSRSSRSYDDKKSTRTHPYRDDRKR